MRAQMTKNAVIVPAGAKGGFYLKAPPADPAERKAEVERQYVRYIDGPAGAHGRPRRRRRRASRGRPGARRGRHLPRRRRRQGHRDVLRHGQPGQRGARLLARRRVRLGRLHRLRPQGARHHGARRVGVGQAPLPRARARPGRPTRSPWSASATCPATCSATACCSRTASGSSAPTTTATSSSTRTPIPAAGFAERTRLFAPAGLLLGRLRPRARSPRAAACGRVGASRSRSRRRSARRSASRRRRLPPNEVIRAILRAPVDLLWNGGIGTVVKASTETDADAMDRASDAIRVDAADLRCRVVGEGGQPRPHAPRPGGVRGGRRARLRRLHRQLRRRRLLGPRGQPEDPARPRREGAAS